MDDAFRILRAPEVCARIGVSNSTLRRMVEQKRFPAPVRLTRQLDGWRASDVAKWFNDQFAKAGVQ
jgi:prophage regulatory protein